MIMNCENTLWLVIFVNIKLDANGRTVLVTELVIKEKKKKKKNSCAFTT